MGYRLEKGGHIDRSQAIQIRWNGRKVSAFAGDTVASALLANDIPVVGPSRTTPGLYHAFGFSGHGFALGPAIGAIMSELVIDGRSTTPIDAFTIDRFAARGKASALPDQARPRNH